jgi:hypothetical protein
MGVYELSGAGSLKTGRTLYTNMGANNVYCAMVPIGTVVADGSFQSAIFNNIPQIYQNLMLVCSLRSTSGTAQDSFQVQVNNATDIYGSTWLRGDGSTGTSTRNTSGFYGAPIGNCPSGGGTSGVFGSSTINVMNYTSTSTFKSIICRSASDLNGSGDTVLSTATLRTTSALTVLHIFTSSANMASGSTVTLYGIRAVS